MRSSAILGAAVLGFVSTAIGFDDRREQTARIIEPLLRDPPRSGLLIFEVLPKLQADRAGFRVGDIVTEFDGREVRTTSQLQKLATMAAKEGRGGLDVCAFRNGQALDAKFDAAPMGIRLVAVNKGEHRILWRPASEFKPDLTAVHRAVGEKHHWELLQYGGNNLGWAHTYYAVVNDLIVMRVQSQMISDQLKEKRDSVVAFSTYSPTLTPKSIRLSIDGKLMMDLHEMGGVLRGTRGGIRDSAPLPADTVSADLGGLVCSMMPRQKGACMRCSYLESGSLVAAPYADLFCLGQDEVKLPTGGVNCVRYDQAVFGRSVVHYWVDSKGSVVQTRFGNGFVAIRSTSDQVGIAFPNAMTEFPPIEQLPDLSPPQDRLAN
jgi:PDZ domain